MLAVSTHSLYTYIVMDWSGSPLKSEHYMYTIVMYYVTSCLLIRYSQSTKTLSNRFVHLTNYSINKKSADFKPNSDETQCFGHKW